MVTIVVGAYNFLAIMITAALIILFLAAPSSDDTVALTAPPEPLWRLHIAVCSAQPEVLPGLAVGASAEVARRFTNIPAFVFARLGWNTASAANVGWAIDQDHYEAAVGAGLLTTLGVGRLFAELGAGASGLYESLSRHQRQRIEAANVSGAVKTAFAMGPFAFADFGVLIQMMGGWHTLLALGPQISRIALNGSERWRSGMSSRLGVAYDF